MDQAPELFSPSSWQLTDMAHPLDPIMASPNPMQITTAHHLHFGAAAAAAATSPMRSLMPSQSKGDMRSFSRQSKGAKRRSASTSHPVRISSNQSKSTTSAAARVCGKRKPSSTSRRPLKPKIREITADKSRFKDIVHQYTGLPPPPPALSCSQRDILLATALFQSVKSLKTISAYLLLHRRSSQATALQKENMEEEKNNLAGSFNSRVANSSSSSSSSSSSTAGDPLEFIKFFLEETQGSHYPHKDKQACFSERQANLAGMENLFKAHTATKLDDVSSLKAKNDRLDTIASLACLLLKNIVSQ